MLKKEFKQVFNYQTQYFTAPIGIPDQENFVATVKRDTLYLYPKEGNWSHGYVAFDLSEGELVQQRVNYGEGTSMFMGGINLNVGNKTYITYVVKIHEKAVWRNSPIRVALVGFTNYIIFGDEGAVSKRWMYQNGKVTWVPED